MGYIDLPHDELGNEIYISIREKLIKAKIVRIPFYKE
jgi:glycine cleavage system aminomethyltransferase T